MNLTEDQIERYSRQIILDNVGGKGQEKLLQSRILIIGAGGLGSPAAFYLAAAGAGNLGIIDGDEVDLSNLQRQILHSTDDVGRAKVDSAKETLEKLNPDINIITYNKRVNAQNISSIISEYDFIIDGTDNFGAKFLINDACVLNKKPYSHGGILRFHGQTITHVPGSACYRCLFETLPPKGAVPSCSEAGVLGVVAGFLGTLQASEAMKYILKTGELLTDSLFYFDILNTEFRLLKIKRNKNCPVCGDNPSISKLEEKNYEQPVCDLKQQR